MVCQIDSRSPSPLSSFLLHGLGWREEEREGREGREGEEFMLLVQRLISFSVLAYRSSFFQITPDDGMHSN